MVFRRTQVAGAQFMTPPSLELQVGVLERPAGFSVRAHTHPARARTASSVAEFLYLESGRVRVRVFDEAWQELALIELLAGEMVLLLRGGHALDVLEHARLVEVRQGPYQALGDKRFA